MRTVALKIFTLFCFTCVSIAMSASEPLEEELQRALDNWNHYVRNAVDSLKIDGYNLIIRSEEENNSLGKGIAFRSIGSGMIRTGEIGHGRQFLKEALHLFEVLEQSELKVETLNEIGHSYMYENRPAEAILWYKVAKVKTKGQGAELINASAILNEALALSELNKHSKAVLLIDKYLEIVLRFEKWESVANAYASKGKIHLNNNELDKAKWMFARSAEYADFCDATVIQSHAINNLGIVAFQQGDMIEAEKRFMEALNLRKKVGNVNWILESLFNCGGYYFEVKKYDLALEMYNQGESLSFSKKIFNQTLDFITAKSELFEITNPEGLLDNDKKYSEVNEMMLLMNKANNNYDQMILELMTNQKNSIQPNNSKINWKTIGLLASIAALFFLFGIKYRS